MRIVVLGKTGSGQRLFLRKQPLKPSLLGKSSLGNSLLHSRTAFRAAQSSASVTTDCQVREYQHTNTGESTKHLTVVDTPGFFDSNTAITNQMIRDKITSQIFEMAAPGVHAFLIVIRIGRFSPEEKQTVDFIREIFGSDAAKYCIVVFTCADQLDIGQTLDDFVRDAPALEGLVQACGGRVFAFDNRLTDQYLVKKVNQLIGMIDKMIRSNTGSYYTNDKFQCIEKKRLEERNRKEEEERRTKKAAEDAIFKRVKTSFSACCQRSTIDPIYIC